MKASNWFSLAVSLSLLALLQTPTVSARECRWDGTAPFCNGACGLNETEITRLGGLPDFWVPPYVNIDPPFGSNCTTGSKALCCQTPGVTCRWDGTAPFCDGECNSNERVSNPPPGSSSGAACWTGSKVYCCRSSTGSGQARLVAAPELTRYAALWTQETGPVWQARHGLTATEHQGLLENLSEKGYRPVEIAGYNDGVQGRYASIWVQKSGPAWIARHGLTNQQFQEDFERLSRDGYRLIDLSGYTVGGTDFYTSIWERREGPAWVAYHGLSAQQFQTEFERLARDDFRLVDVSGYAIGGEDRYAAFWEKTEGPAWAAHHGLSSEQYQQHFNDYAQQGFRLTRVSSWLSGNEPRYAAIWGKIEGPAWAARHGMMPNVYQDEFAKFASEGYRLERVSGYHPFEGQ